MARHYQDISPELFEDICRQIENGKSLVNICKESKIDRSSVTKAIRESEELDLRYARAREIQADFLADEAKDMLDAEPRLKADQFGNMSIDPAWVQLQKAKADQRKWHAGKLKPKVYGDSTTVKGDKDSPLFNFADALNGAQAALQQHREQKMIDITPTVVEDEPDITDTESPI